jgi:hypothetical protein
MKQVKIDNFKQFYMVIKVKISKLKPQYLLLLFFQVLQKSRDIYCLQ